MWTVSLHGLILCVSEGVFSAFLCIHIVLCAWKLLAFMNWFYVSLKVCFLRCFVFTLCAWKLLAFMDWFYVCLKGCFPSCFVFTMRALKLLAFMDWFYVSLKGSFLFWVNLDPHCGHGNCWPSWTDFMCLSRLVFQVVIIIRFIKSDVTLTECIGHSLQ